MRTSVSTASVVALSCAFFGAEAKAQQGSGVPAGGRAESPSGVAGKFLDDVSMLNALRAPPLSKGDNPSLPRPLRIGDVVTPTEPPPGDEKLEEQARSLTRDLVQVRKQLARGVDVDFAERNGRWFGAKLFGGGLTVALLVSAVARWKRKHDRTSFEKRMPSKLDARSVRLALEDAPARGDKIAVLIGALGSIASDLRRLSENAKEPLKGSLGKIANQVSKQLDVVHRAGIVPVVSVPGMDRQVILCRQAIDARKAEFLKLIKAGEAQLQRDVKARIASEISRRVALAKAAASDEPRSEDDHGETNTTLARRHLALVQQHKSDGERVEALKARLAEIADESVAVEQAIRAAQLQLRVLAAEIETLSREADEVRMHVVETLQLVADALSNIIASDPLSALLAVSSGISGGPVKDVTASGATDEGR